MPRVPLWPKGPLGKPSFACHVFVPCFVSAPRSSTASPEGSLFLSLFLSVLLSLSSPAWLCLLLDCPCRCWLGRRLLSLLVGIFLKSGLAIILQDSLDGGSLVPAPQLAVQNSREGQGSYPPPLPPSGASGGRALCIPFKGLCLLFLPSYSTL